MRSSALDEDGSATSFAGQHETFLNVRGLPELHAAIERCLESARSPRALTYRRDRGPHSNQLRMTVTAQNGTQEIDVPQRDCNRPSVSDAECIDAVRMAIALEDAMGWPVDVECAWQDGICYLLQCRPITTLTIVGVPLEARAAAP